MNRNLVSHISFFTNMVLALTEGVIFFDHMNFVIHTTFTIAYIDMLSTTYMFYVSVAFLPVARIYK